MRLALLQILPPAALYDAIAAEDVTAISRAHGVGKKIAQRIATELQSKLGALAGAGGESFKIAARQKAGVAAVSDPVLAARADAVSALAHLGYDGGEARRAVSLAAESRNGAGVEDLIKAALKELTPA